MRTPPVDSSDQGLGRHFAAGLRRHIARGCVYRDAVGGDFAAANRTAVDRSRSNVSTEARGEVSTESLVRIVYGRRPQKGILQNALDAGL